MIVTIAVVLCLRLAPGPLHLDRDCAPEEQTIEEIVTDSSLDEDVTFQSCMVSGQIGVAAWKASHPIYRADKWRIARIRCVPGHYEIRGRA